MADSVNSFVVDADGRLYKCWNEIGATEECVGSLEKPEAMTERINNSLRYLAYDPTRQSECTNCKYLPICMGGCPKVRQQHEHGHGRCCYHMNCLEEYMRDTIRATAKTP